MSDFAAPLRRKRALVTGAATGIGKGIATALAAAGARVVVDHNHTPEPAEKLAPAINEAGGTAMALAAFGRWDILVNNAAVAITKAFPEVTEAEFGCTGPYGAHSPVLVHRRAQCRRARPWTGPGRPAGQRHWPNQNP